MPAKVRKFSSRNALFATPSRLTELDQCSVESTVENQEPKTDLATRKYIFFYNLKLFCSGALSGKGKWTDKTLDKYLKSPADYAPGK